MKFQLLTVILISVTMSALAQLCLKLGVGRATQPETLGTGSQLSAMLMSPYVLLGLALYGIGAVVWLFVLSRAPLSLAYPFVGIGFILTTAIGALVLGEQVSIGRLAGTLLIAIVFVVVERSA